ncbi:MAG TPA: MaoC/PaaZ C-terminal domain-containing protein [Ramlibacter sp.]|uniref:MaoC/PaaZ C-terminal domain-containing protein n=1 Tax=Ramlibacter sp. TaxID=1917967 RepID=UPI002CA4EAEF|nr:MaoC/PaaZ C-terminal domain-containing protein [Ramlibacter sp.]HVZ45791.1 MaoC/PaaZ C-terminal domain-containing protein [Ramlibacter sp.]
MPIYYPDVLSQETQERTFSYTRKDVILYALGVGMGTNPLDENELRFIYEKDLRVVPSAATVLSNVWGSSWPPPAYVQTKPGLRNSTIDPATVLHGEQKVVLHRPLPPEGRFTTRSRYIGAFDKGAGKGAVVVSEATWRDEEGTPVATLTSTAFGRSEGGFGGPREGQPAPHIVPTRAPDRTVEVAIPEGQAALYRLSGDTNPLHIDPQAARRAGFERPILHGLCAFGITCRVVLAHMANHDDRRIRSHQLRWTAPVYPGDVLAVDLWRDGTQVSFAARVPARNVTVVGNGLTVLADGS